MSDVGKTLGSEIRRLRMANCCSLRRMATSVGVSAPFMSDVELGRRYPSGPTLNAIANSLGVRASELRKLDHRPQLKSFAALLRSSPVLAEKFVAMVDAHKSGQLTTETMTMRIGGRA